MLVLLSRLDTPLMSRSLGISRLTNHMNRGWAGSQVVFVFLLHFFSCRRIWSSAHSLDSFSVSNVRSLHWIYDRPLYDNQPQCILFTFPVLFIYYKRTKYYCHIYVYKSIIVVNTNIYMIALFGWQYFNIDVFDIYFCIAKVMGNSAFNCSIVLFLQSHWSYIVFLWDHKSSCILDVIT